MKTFFKKIKDKLVHFVNYNKDEAVAGKKSEVGKDKTPEVKRNQPEFKRPQGEHKRNQPEFKQSQPEKKSAERYPEKRFKKSSLKVKRLK